MKNKILAGLAAITITSSMVAVFVCVVLYRSFAVMLGWIAVWAFVGVCLIGVTLVVYDGVHTFLNSREPKLPFRRKTKSEFSAKDYYDQIWRE